MDNAKIISSLWRIQMQGMLHQVTVLTGRAAPDEIKQKVIVTWRVTQKYQETGHHKHSRNVVSF